MAIKNEIKISIIVPVYNSELSIEKCLTSLVNQSIKEIQIICVNDGSLDKSIDILNKFSALDSRIEVVDLKANNGQSYARNIALEIVKGQYIGFVDADDFVDLDYYEKLYNEAKKNNCEIVMAGIRLHKRSGKTKIIDNFQSEILEKNNQKISYLNNGSTCTKIFSSNLISKYQIRFPIDLVYEDNVFLIKAVLNAKKICTLHNCLYNYINNPVSTMQNEQNKVKRNNSKIEILKILMNIFADFKDVSQKVKYRFIYKSIYRDITLKSALRDINNRKLLLKIWVFKFI